MKEAYIAKKVEDLSHDNWKVRYRAVIALTNIGIPAIYALLIAMKDPDDRVHDAAGNALKKIGGFATPFLLEALNDPDDYIRYFAVETLGEIGDETSILPLILMMNDKFADTQYCAIKALIRIGVLSVPDLIEALKKSENILIRQNAAVALGEIGDLSAVDSLLDALRDGYDIVYYNAENALLKIGDSQTLPGKILLSSGFSPSEKVEILKKMRRARTRNIFQTVFSFPEVYQLCDIWMDDADEEGCANIRAVMNWVNGECDLLHASERNSEKDSQELLRPTTGAAADSHFESLLRSSDESKIDDSAVINKVTIWKRIFRKAPARNKIK